MELILELSFKMDFQTLNISVCVFKFFLRDDMIYHVKEKKSICYDKVWKVNSLEISFFFSFLPNCSKFRRDGHFFVMRSS